MHKLTLEDLAHALFSGFVTFLVAAAVFWALGIG